MAGLSGLADSGRGHFEDPEIGRAAVVEWLEMSVEKFPGAGSDFAPAAGSK